MPLQTFRARVARCRDLTHDVRELDLELIEPPELAFQAGQFISFEVLPPGAARPVTRPYSIASPPSRRGILTLLFNRVPGGPGSGFLFGLRPGDEVRFKGPAGHFTLKDDGTRDRLFVATGTGIAPIRSMLLALRERGDARRATLYWGLRSRRDLYYQEELAALATEHPGFSAVVTLSRPEPDWTGEVGRVTRLVEERITSVAGLAAYLCGNGAMIKEVTALLNRRGLCPVYREKYYDERGPEPDE
jgi:NAD(P)H-flavin reductase